MFSSEQMMSLYSSDLGNGWDIARLDDDSEILFIGEVHHHFFARHPYWMGGTTDLMPGTKKPSVLQLREECKSQVQEMAMNCLHKIIIFSRIS